MTLADTTCSTAGPEEEAALWLERLKVADANQRCEFDAWLRRSPSHVEAFMETSLLAMELEHLGREAPIKIASLLPREAGNVVPFPGMARPALAEAGLAVTGGTRVVPLAGAKLKWVSVLGVTCVLIGLCAAALMRHLRQG